MSHRQLAGLILAGWLGVALGAGPAMGAITVVGTNFGLESAAAPDGVTVDASGNLLVYGSFELVNGEFNPNVARLHPDGSLDSDWRPLPNDGVTKALVGADGIYLAGPFEAVAGVPRLSLVKVRADTGALIPEFNPAPSEPVNDIALLGNAIFAGGTFTNIGGQARQFIAKLDGTTGAAASGFTNGPVWEGSQVITLAVDETGLYPGGFFLDIGDEPRMCIAKVSTDTGDAIPDTFLDGVGGGWGIIQRLRAFGNYVYAIGMFEEIGGEERMTFARMHRATGTTDTNFPCGITNDVDGTVVDCAVAANAVFVGGDFTNYFGAHDFIAKVGLADGMPVSGFTAQVNDAVTCLAPMPNGKIAAAGWFTGVAEQPAGGVAVLDPATGAADTGFYARIGYNAQIVAAVQLADGGWIVGGSFDRSHDAGVPNLARFNANGELDADWGPWTGGNVNALVADGTHLYVGCAHITNVVKLALNTGAMVTNFNAGSSVGVYSMALSGDALYVGGQFNVMGGGVRKNLAKLDKNTGAFDPAFTADASGYVNDLVVDGEHLYVVGTFTQINAVACGRVARVDADTGAPDAAWCSNSFANSRISALAVTPAAVFVGGDFTNIGGVARASLAKLGKTDGSPDPAWNPGCLPYVFAMHADGAHVYVGGNFNAIGGHPITNAARVAIDTGLVDTNWVPMPDGTVYGFMFQPPYMFMYGNFFEVSGVQRQGFAVLTHGLPQAAITAPAPGTEHWEQSVATIVLEARAQADTGLSITQVAYYANGVLVGAATADPYSILWTPVPEGQYAVTAVAYDNLGLAGAPSAPVNIAVTPLATAGDFDGDGKADPALLVINPDTGASEWYAWCSGSGYARVGPRLPGEDLSMPLAGDFDGDGKADPALWWTDQVGGEWKNIWYLWRSSMNYAPMGPVSLGAAGAQPVFADFDGDGKADPGIYKTDGVYNIWRAWQSASGYADTGDVRMGAWIDGTALAADFDGDGKADPAMFTQNQWYAWLSGAGYGMIGPREFTAPAGGLPVAADFDGDGKADPAVYVPAASGYASGWYVWLSGAGYGRLGPYAFTAP